MGSIATSSNPYRPSWGTAPPVLAGRDAHLDDSMAALEAGPTHPLFHRIWIGDRGTGKTVLLDALADRARARGWRTVALACRPGAGLAESLVELHLPAALRSLSRRRARPADTTFGAGIGVPSVASISASASWRGGERRTGVELERLLTAVGEAAARRRSRVLLTVDELHGVDTRTDLPTVAGVLQLVAQRRRLPVALVGAGLPEVVDVLAGPSVTFLERLRKSELGALTLDACRYALLAPAQQAGVVLEVDAADLLARASGGFPFYVQLLGWEAWAAAAGAGASSITVDHARAGARAASGVVVEQVLLPRFRRLPPKEQAYLRAMALDGDAGSTTADLVRRLGARSASDISYLRERLLTRRMIRATGRGQVAFSLPGMGAWLQHRERGLVAGSG